MKKLVLGLLVLVALPQLAGAQNFGGDYKYVAKFMCGRISSSGETGLSVIEGHYNKIINVLSVKNKTAAAFRTTWLADYVDDCSFDVDRGVPSDYSERIDFDRDEGGAIGCHDIKDQIGRCQGFVEGMVVIYSSRPLVVTDVITAQDVQDGDGPLSVMRVFDVREIKTSEKITPRTEELPQ